jgi:hypothetical protein
MRGERWEEFHVREKDLQSTVEEIVALLKAEPWKNEINGSFCESEKGRKVSISYLVIHL